MKKELLYDHNIDQKEYKWSGKSKIKKIDDKIFYQDYLINN